MTIGADTRLDDLALGSPQEPNAFRERPEETLRRWGLGVAYALRPNRIRSVPPLLALTAARLLSGDRGLPHGTGARDDCNSLCGLVADLAPATLLEAYGRGLYPFCHIEPLKWWAPPERMVLFYPEFHIAKRLRRQIRNGGYRVTFDRAFADVIRACAKPRAGKAPLTWITPRVMAAYTEAFHAGHAHSFEVWNADGDLVRAATGSLSGGCSRPSRSSPSSRTPPRSASRS